MGFITAILRVLGAVTGLLEISHRMKGARGRAVADGGPGVAGGRVDRDEARLDLERARFEAERQRADASLRLERLRQAAARQVGEVHLIAWVAVAGWLASALVALRLGNAAASGGRVLLGTGWAALLAALACALVAHARVAREFAARLEDGRAQVTFNGGAATAARWLLVAGLGLTGAGFLLRLG